MNEIRQLTVLMDAHLPRVRETPAQRVPRGHASRASARTATDWYVDADTLGLAMHRWRDRERIRDRPGPYIFAVSRTRMTEIDLR